MYSRDIDRGHFLSHVSHELSDENFDGGWQLIEDCRLNIEYLRSAAGGINLKKDQKKGRAKSPARRGFSAYTSESDIHKSSIFNSLSTLVAVLSH